MQCQWTSMMRQSSNVFYSFSGHRAKSCGWDLWIGFVVFSFSGSLDYSWTCTQRLSCLSCATTWQTQNTKSRWNAIIALFTIISGSFEEGGDPINTLTNNSHQESIVAMPFRTLYEDTPPHNRARSASVITPFTPTVTLMIQ